MPLSNVQAAVLPAADSIDAAYRKVIWRLIPFLCFCYLASYLDRINVGFAKLQMLDHLHLSETAYGLGAGLFFVGYILFEVPSNLVLEKVGARLWIARIMISWGLLSGLTMFVTQQWQFHTLRFLLGAAEAGFLPGVLYYLSQWFPSWRRSRIIALFMIGLPLSSLVGSPISGWIMGHFNGASGLAGWQWLFLLEAVPTVVLGFVCIAVLPDNIGKAPWLSADEKQRLQGILADDEQQNPGGHSFRDGFFDIRVWMLGGIDFSILLSAYAMGFWLPTFIRNAGVNDPQQIGLLVALPSLAGLVGMLAIGASSDKHRERRWHIVVPFLVGAAAMFLSTFVTHNVAMTVLLFSLASLAIIGAVPVFFSLPATFLKGTAAATGFALACSVANIAGLVSNSLMGVVMDHFHSPQIALWIFAGCLLLSCLLVLGLPAKTVNR
ncbi:MFS transporter [Pseudomonas typographi]|uniref:MFS transporter n=1 Tax=Pseudomonas typographi TaxID=2715964 RepID=A0ABR7Z096_9PSED|nr:MFS transporter [Pseudomonas typographi]MBD1551344.1 MFS transporter [Pseudomonas typographi]MBD1588774.1 MFS transporter [Pseudomonas typographi]MBD1598890.1 MFS transporter [Pseudomonas typographi]